jgi:alcohol dehydrogenase
VQSTLRTRAAVLEEIGRPAPYGQSRPLRIDEVELDPPGPGEVLVRIAAAGLCHSDLSVVDGARPRPVPMVLGHEAAGVIEEVGAGVSDFHTGDHVVFSFVPVCGTCVPCQSGRPALCDPGARANTLATLLSGARPFHRAGERLNHHLGVSGFSEYTVASTTSLVRIPAHVPMEKAALFGCALLTGVGAVVNTARVEVGASAAVFGLGGVGMSAVMAAKVAGSHPIVAVDTVPEKLALAVRLGATHTVLAGDGAVEAVRDLTSGGADYAFEAAGSAAVLADAYSATRRGGTTVSVGLPHPEQRLSIPAVSVAGEERRLVGSYMGSAVPRRDIPRYLRLHEAGLLPVQELASRQIRLDQLNEALDELVSGQAVRQIVVLGERT